MSAMIKVATENLEGLALDWAVGIADGRNLELPSGARGRTKVVWLDPFVVKLEGRPDFHDKTYRHWAPSTDWAQGGPLIDKYQLDLTFERKGLMYAYQCQDDGLPIIVTEDAFGSYGPTHLIAICRAIVAAKLGLQVSVPAELVQA